MNTKEIMNIFDNDLKEVSISGEEYDELVEQYRDGIENIDSVDDVLTFFDEVIMEVSVDQDAYNTNKIRYTEQLASILKWVQLNLYRSKEKLIQFMWI